MLSPDENATENVCRKHYVNRVDLNWNIPLDKSGVVIDSGVWFLT